ncbi:MAG: hypothetical protein AAFP82_19250, partial [Bacteroidota bacterium]
TININIGSIAFGSVTVSAIIYFIFFTSPIPTENQLPTIDPFLTTELSGQPEVTKKDGSTNIEKIKPSEITKKPNNPKNPERKLSDFVDITQHPKVVYFNSNNLKISGIKKITSQTLQKSGIQPSSTYFRSRFFSTYGRDLNNIDFAALKTLGFDDSVNCICQISENITYEENNMEGYKTYTARGQFDIIVYNQKISDLKTHSINLSGAGISKTSALESLKEHLLTSKDFDSLDFSSCI